MGGMDARIILGGKPPDFDTPAESASKVATARAQQINLQKLARGVSDEQEIRRAVASNTKKTAEGREEVDWEAAIPAVARIDPDRAMKMQDSVGKIQRDVMKRQIDDLEYAGRVMGPVLESQDPEMYAEARKQILARNPQAAPMLPERMHLPSLRVMAGRALDRRDQLTQQWKEKGFDREEKRDAETVRHNRAMETRAEKPSMGHDSPAKDRYFDTMAEVAKQRESRLASSKVSDLAAVKSESQYKSARLGLDEAIEAIDEALGSALGDISGPVASRSWDVFPAAITARAKLKRVAAMGTLESLTNLKARGGTLGALSEGEGKMLADSSADIAAAQNETQLRDALKRFKKRIEKHRVLMDDAFSSESKIRRGGEASQESAAPAASEPIPFWKVREYAKAKNMTIDEAIERFVSRGAKIGN